jgi:hypothetical protein
MAVGVFFACKIVSRLSFRISLVIGEKSRRTRASPIDAEVEARVPEQLTIGVERHRARAQDRSQTRGIRRIREVPPVRSIPPHL